MVDIKNRAEVAKAERRRDHNLSKIDKAYYVGFNA